MNTPATHADLPDEIFAAPAIERIPCRPVGLHYDVPMSEYIRWDAFNASALKGRCLGDTFRQFRWDYNHPKDDDSIAKTFGRAAEIAVQRPHEFDQLVQCLPAMNPETGKKFIRSGHVWAAMQADNPGVEWVSAKDFDKAKDVAMRLWANKRARELLTGAAVQVCCVWRDPDSGLTCKARADFLSETYGLLDLKTTRYRQPYRAVRAGWSMGYHVQSAMYTDGFSVIIDGYDPETKPIPFRFIFIESLPPHDVFSASGHACSDEAGKGRGDDMLSRPFGYLDDGRSAYKLALGGIAYCIKTGDWPGHGYDDYVDGNPPDDLEMVKPAHASYDEGF